MGKRVIVDCRDQVFVFYRFINRYMCSSRRSVGTCNSSVSIVDPFLHLVELSICRHSYSSLSNCQSNPCIRLCRFCPSIRSFYDFSDSRSFVRFCDKRSLRDFVDITSQCFFNAQRYVDGSEKYLVVFLRWMRLCIVSPPRGPTRPTRLVR